MADPLPYRPPTVVEEKAKVEKSDALKLTIRKPELFMKAMSLWHLYMTPRERAKLTKKKLMKRAVYEAGQLHMNIKSLPTNWIKTLQETELLELFIKKSTLERRKRRKEELERQKAMETFEKDFKPKKDLISIAEAESVLGEELTRITVKQENEDGRPKSKFKKWIDLTHEAPPKGWLDGLRKGILPPRIQAVHSTPEANYLYWDYKMEHWQPVDEEALSKPRSETVMHSHEGNEFEWFSKQILEEMRKKEVLAEEYGISVRALSRKIQDKIWDEQGF